MYIMPGRAHYRNRSRHLRAGPGVPRSAMGLTDPSKAAAVVNSVNTLSTGLLNLGKILPDIDRFAAIDDIEKGAIVAPQTLLDASEVLVGFGLPMGVLAYLILKKKEVAP